MEHMEPKLTPRDWIVLGLLWVGIVAGLVWAMN